ncbi:hypothetical protein GCM10009827_012330 [Dactylosporangium maewongense]|uniref:Alpha-1,2-mannosyltransferase n=1 Tax=Dactylosporangium maewongense TaxID=634393 RepID=A0ABN1ZPM5_9ACTN
MRQRVAYVATGAGLLAAVLVSATLTSWNGLFDLRVYRGAVSSWLAGGDLYAYLLPGSPYGFTYPPAAAILMAPLAVAPWPVAVGASFVVSAAALTGVLSWLVGPLTARTGWPPGAVLLCATASAAMLDPVRAVFSFGQVNLVLLGLVAADLGLLVARRHRLAGIGIGLAAAVKLVPLVFVLYLLATRRYRAAATAAATFGAAGALTAAVAPDASRRFWLGALFELGRVGEPGFVFNQSLYGALVRLLPDAAAVPAWVALSAVLAAAWCWAVRRTGDVRLGLALTGALGCLCSPISWGHHLVWLIPALVVLAEAGAVAVASGAWAVLCSRLIWTTEGDRAIVAAVVGNVYVLASLALFAALLRTAIETGAPHPPTAVTGGSTPNPAAFKTGDGAPEPAAAKTGGGTQGPTAALTAAAPQAQRQP